MIRRALAGIDGPIGLRGPHMATDAPPKAWWKTMLRRQWPWLVLALLLIPAVWHVVDFDEDIDPEFPRVERPTFSRVPPAAYRLAEPGDTLDRIELYLAAAGVVLAAGGLAAGRERGLWPAGLAIALAGLWYSATPGPTVDGWYGLGWRTIVRCPCAVGVARGAARRRDRAGRGRRRRAPSAGEIASARSGPPRRRRGSGGLWIAALVLAVARQFEIPGVEPARLLAALGDDRGAPGLRPGPPDRAGPAPELAVEPVGRGRRWRRPAGSPWWPSGSP